MRILFFFLSLSIFFGCKTTSESGVSSTKGNQVENEEWLAYVSDVKQGDPLQTECYPTSFKHQTENLKGAVILLHGFSACPQQFYDLAKRLSALGWDVLLPLNPGHGQLRGPSEQAKLPNIKNYRTVFPAFVARMNKIMSTYNTENKVIGGFSLGGAMATLAVSDNPTLYNRALIMVPLYKASGFMSNILGGIKNIEEFNQWITPGVPTLNSVILRKTVGWGKGCDDEGKRGRAGICNFNITNLIGAQQFGYDIFESKTITTRVQYIAVEGDSSADTPSIIDYYRNKVKTSDSDKSICVYRAPTNHSLASRYDSPDEDKFWLESYEDQFIDYVANNKFFKHGSRDILGEKECYIP